MPLVQPDKFELVTARMLDPAVSPALLARTDEVIE